MEERGSSMRLSQKEQETLVRVFREIFGQEDHLWLFGSRTDDQKRGGDIDLYVETMDADMDLLVQRHLAFMGKVKSILGDQKIDLVINQLPAKKEVFIYEVAKKTGIPLI